MAKALVFGGSGFLGSYVVDELQKQSYDVTIADINAPIHHPDTVYRQCDISEPASIRDVMQAASPDIVYNFSAFSNIDDAAEDPSRTFQLNVMGHIYILEALPKNVRRFIYASSCYAMSSKGSFYGISKLTSEKLTEEFSRIHGIPFTILRYGSVYGERASANNYLYNLIRQAVQNGKIIHHGDGQEIREYIHAADAAALSVEILKSSDYENRHLILTGVERMRRVELFEMIREIMNNDVTIELRNDGYQNHYRYTPYSFQANRSEKLVANPFIDLGQGLLNLIENLEKESHE